MSTPQHHIVVFLEPPADIARSRVRAQMLARWLASGNCTVRVAETAAQALMFLWNGLQHAQAFDAVVTNSAALTRGIRECPMPLKVTPVLFRGTEVSDDSVPANAVLPDTADLEEVGRRLTELIVEHHRRFPPEEPPSHIRQT